MPDYQIMTADAALAIMAFAATFYLLKARKLFFKDVMGRVFGLTAAALFVIVLFSLVDFVLNIVGIGLGFPLLRFVGTASASLVLVAMIMLVRWTNLSAEW